MIPRPSEDLRLETEEFLYSNTPDPVQLQQLFCAVTRHFPAFSIFFRFSSFVSLQSAQGRHHSPAN
jgi:hypothetical protein